jgi:predicted TIM-barrel fold metal-dependent hydrolase
MSQETDRYMIVSSDCHAGADVADYKPYLERRWHDEFDAWAATYHDKWLEVDPGPASTRREEELKIGISSGTMIANWDSEERIRDLDADGVVGEVVFPNTAPPFFPSGVITAGTPKTHEEYERRWAGLKAHNRWLVDFCSQLPGQRAGIAQIFLNDIEDAVAEIEWVRNAGLFGGILVPVIEHTAPVPPLFTNAYDRIWAACVDFDVAAHQHAGVAGLYEDYAMTDAGKAMFILEGGSNANRGLWHMIFGGAFERYPKLKFVMTEQGTHWIPSTLATLDAFDAMGRDPKNFGSRFLAPSLSKLNLKPSEYFARNVWIGASMMGRNEVEAGVIEVAGDRLMWGNDYPHSEGTYPHTTEWISAAFFDRTIEETQQILGDTAVEFYGFDRGTVRKAADRVGPAIERVTQGVTA